MRTVGPFHWLSFRLAVFWAHKHSYWTRARAYEAWAHDFFLGPSILIGRGHARTRRGPAIFYWAHGPTLESDWWTHIGPNSSDVKLTVTALFSLDGFKLTVTPGVN